MTDRLSMDNRDEWRAYAEERLARYAEQGFTHAENSDAGDEFVCARCKALAPKPIPIDEFRARAAAHFCESLGSEGNCRCVIMCAEGPEGQ